MNSQTTNLTAADEEVIRAIHQRMIDAWNAGDAVAFAAPFTDEANFVAFEGTRLKGRREIVSFHRQIFDTVVQGTRLEGQVNFVHGVSPGVAVMHSAVRVTLQGQTEAPPSRDSMQLTVVAKRDGQWRSGDLMNARRLTLERQLFLDDIDALPAEAQRQVTDLVASLKKPHLT
ncbi:MAG: SgcJ/EcaC family oxidoreductase [Candidatus Binatia bacterium]